VPTLRRRQPCLLCKHGLRWLALAPPIGGARRPWCLFVDPDIIGNVVLETGGTFAVLGGHTYLQAGTYPVTVSLSDAGGGIVSVANSATVAGPAPAVTGLSPFYGPTISGTALAGATAVSFGGKNAI
jgi:hypothetical protein